MDPIDALLGLERFGIKPGLDVIRRLTEAAGHPDHAYRSIHVAGTNGKGSVVAMLDSLLRAAGHRVGRYTSPHLTSLTERFVIDGTPITDHELRQEAAGVFVIVDRLLQRGELHEPPTFFEATTAIALSWFQREAVELAVLEVGLGGRLDATNVVTPIASVITAIALDHEDYLGNTVEAIAIEKAGIIKPDTVVVTTETTPGVVAVLETTCRRLGARLIRAGDDTRLEPAAHNPSPTRRVVTPRRSYPPIALGLVGAHQWTNALGAIRLAEEIVGLGVPVDQDAIVTGLSRVSWPGRLETITLSDGNRVLLDAAHNPAAAAALAEYLRATFPNRLPIVCAVMNDKDVEGIADALATAATCLVCTAPGSRRALPPETLAARVRERVPSVPVIGVERPQDALEAAWRHATLVCVTGSVFLVGELRETLTLGS
ncbi:MAG: cyanophycin synthetase [Acidobacteriota bacterium]|nr:cyanophycin synthetase [Acidobacteriota bacterium]